MFVEGYDMSKVDTLQWRANKLLASKSPEMAELLIEIAQKATDGIIDDDTYINNMLELGHKAEDLIKEIGYEAPSADRDKP